MFSQTRGNVDLKWPIFQKYNVLAFVENSFLTKITAKGTKLDKTGIFLFT